MNVVSLSDELHQRVQLYIQLTTHPDVDAPAFQQLACGIARFQATHLRGMENIYRRNRLLPDELTHCDQIPAVPADAFRATRVAVHPPSLDTAIFRTSGTTFGARGEHVFRTLATYDHAAVAWGKHMLIATSTSAVVVALVPPPSDASDSSLGHMCDLFGRTFGTATEWCWANGTVDVARLRLLVGSAYEQKRPVLLLGTSFAFAFLFDLLAAGTIPLPPGSRVMPTGGFKGRRREIDADSFRSALATTFAIDPSAVVTEYGMTELSSQAYEGTWRRACGLPDATSQPGWLVPAPWMRVQAVDPASLAPVPAGTEGIARIVDLANVDSAVVVQTMDRILTNAAGHVRVLGRWAHAPPRGCSLATEELVESASFDAP